MKLIGTCKECKYGYPDGGCSLTSKLVEADEQGAKTPVDGLLAVCSRFGNASLTTGPDFGCIHWEERDD